MRILLCPSTGTARLYRGLFSRNHFELDRLFRGCIQLHSLRASFILLQELRIGRSAGRNVLPAVDQILAWFQGSEAECSILVGAAALDGTAWAVLGDQSYGRARYSLAVLVHDRTADGPSGRAEDDL